MGRRDRAGSVAGDEGRAACARGSAAALVVDPAAAGALARPVFRYGTPAAATADPDRQLRTASLDGLRGARRILRSAVAFGMAHPRDFIEWRLLRACERNVRQPCDGGD